MALNLSHVDANYIQARRSALMTSGEAPKRLERMNKYVRMYLMDVYESEDRDRVKVSLPVAAEIVDKLKAVLVTRPPVIKVPYNSANTEEQERAQKVEAWLYGMAERTNWQRVVADAEWYALCMGLGCIRYMWDAEAPEDDFPVVLTTHDPRTLFGQESPSRDRWVELVHTWERTRREIEAEWGKVFARPSGMTPEMEASWLDAKVIYTEYWLEVQVKEEPEDDSAYSSSGKLLTDRIAEIVQRQMVEAAGLEVEEPAKPAPRKRRVRKIVHSVIVDDVHAKSGASPIMLKKPVFLRGFKQIPYVFWSGTTTPLPGSNAHLSVLFPLSSGDAGQKSMGVLAAMNLLTSIDVDSAFRAPNAPLWTDDQSAPGVDMSPDALNKVTRGATISRIPVETTNQAVQRQMELMSGQIARHSIPSILSGDVIQQLSGQAISGYATVFQMLVGERQKAMERALMSLLSGVLCMVKHWADPELGVRAWGNTSRGVFVDEALRPADIKDYRVHVKLSASMPKDDVGTISMLSMLQQKGQYSLESLLDQVQTLIGMASDTPTNEIVRILRDKWIMETDFTKQMAQMLAQDYADLIVERHAPLASAAEYFRAQQQRQAMQEAQPPQQPPAPDPSMMQQLPPELLAQLQGQQPQPPQPPQPPGAVSGMPMGAMPGGGVPPGAPRMPLPPGVSEEDVAAMIPPV